MHQLNKNNYYQKMKKKQRRLKKINNKTKEYKINQLINQKQSQIKKLKNSKCVMMNHTTLQEY